MIDRELRDACLGVIETSEAMYLTCIDGEGFPKTRAMLNLRNRDQYPDHTHLYTDHQDDFLVYVGTNTSSKKRAELAANPKVALYFCRPREFKGVLLCGEIEFVLDAETKKAVWVEGWERYYRETGGPDDPDYTLLRLFPSSVSGWYQGRKFEFRPTQR